MKNNAANNKPHGAKEWLYQRLSALLLLPLLLWFGYFFFMAAKYLANGSYSFIEFISKPLNSILFLLMMWLASYHGFLGMKVILEDYISNVKLQKRLIMSVKTFMAITVGAICAAIFHLIIS